MATTPAAISGSARGIKNTLSGFVVESEEINSQAVVEEFDDQNGARADEVAYDTRTDLSLTVYSASAATTAPAEAGSTFAYASKKWHVDSVREAGTYNARRRWTISAHRYENYPSGT